MVLTVCPGRESPCAALMARVCREILNCRDPKFRAFEGCLTSWSIIDAPVCLCHRQSCCPAPLRPSATATPSRIYAAKELFPYVGDFEDGSFLFPRDWRRRRRGDERTPTPGSTSSPSLASPVCSPGKNRKNGRRAANGVSEHHGYQQPTVSSRSRALSPYTHRKMCQLSEDTRQRLGHLQLGPHHFKKETALQRPFLVGNNVEFCFFFTLKSCLQSRDLLIAVLREGLVEDLWHQISAETCWLFSCTLKK